MDVFISRETLKKLLTSFGSSMLGPRAADFDDISNSFSLKSSIFSVSSS